MFLKFYTDCFREDCIKSVVLSKLLYSEGAEVNGITVGGSGFDD
jgi:hypothetical protein